MNQDLSIIRLVLDASFVVQIVLAILIAASVASWAFCTRLWMIWRSCCASPSTGGQSGSSSASTATAAFSFS